MFNLEEMINGLFECRVYNEDRSHAMIFHAKLNEFGRFQIYNDFEHMLSDNFFYLEDPDGNIMDMNIILNNIHEFNFYIRDMFAMSNFIGFSYENIHKPFLFGRLIKNVDKPIEYYEFVDDIKDESELIIFVNDVLNLIETRKYEVVKLLN